MKTMSKIYAVLLAVLLLSAGVVGAVSANDTLEPWEEEFLEEYGESWMYEDYGKYWFEYYLNEGDDEEYYYELLQMYEALAAENAEKPEVTETPIKNITNTSVQNVTNTSVLNVTNTSALNTTNTSTLNVTNTSVLNLTNTSVLNVTNTSILNLTNTTIQNETLLPTQNTTNNSSLNVTVQGDDPESGVPVVPIIIGCVVAVLLIAGVAVVLVKRKGKSSEDILGSPELTAENPVEETKVVPSEEASPAVVSETPVVEAKAAVSLTTPKECYAAVSSCIADKYGIEHVSSLTPRQLLSFGEPTAELKEFVQLYEQVRYAPNAETDNAAKLSALARTILKQYSA